MKVSQKSKAEVSVHTDLDGRMDGWMGRGGKAWLYWEEGARRLAWSEPASCASPSLQAPGFSRAWDEGRGRDRASSEGSLSTGLEHQQIRPPSIWAGGALDT